MDAITLTLPWPVSSNRYWRTFMPKGFKAPVTTLSKEAKDYKQAVGSLAKEAGISEPISGRVAVSYVLYPQRPQDWAKRAAKDPVRWDDSVQCLDLDNALKVTLDSLKGVVFGDDKFVFEIHGKRAEPDGVGRMVVTVSPIISQSHQPALI